MSDDCLLGNMTGNNRILDAVGGNKQLAKEIEDALNVGAVEKVLSRVDKNGIVTTYRLDVDGKIIGTWP